VIWALSLVIAVVLWGYVAFYINPEGATRVDGIPVEFRNESALAQRDLMLVGGSDLTVDARFTGRIQNLANVNRDTVRAVVDLRNVTTAGETSMAFVIEGAEIHNLTSVHPIQNVVTVTVDRRISKFVALRLDFAGVVAEGFMLDPAEFYPSRIQIEGPKKEIDSVYEAVVRYEPLDPLSRSVTDAPFDYALYTANGDLVDSAYITRDSPNIWLTLPVIMEKTVPLTVDLMPGGGLTEAFVDIDIEPKSVRIAGEPALLESLNHIQIARINLAAMQEEYTETIVIPYPEGVRNLDFIDEVRVSVRSNAPERDVLATNIIIQGLNPPEGHTHNIVTSSLLVTLRGPQEDLERVEPIHVRVVADFTGVEITAAGRLRISASISLDGFETVGAIDKGYEVTIEIVSIDNEAQ
jgi:YbbR domain-containing protein